MRAEDKSEIGVRARAARERLGLNQAEVAERIGISNEVYGRFERGLVTPRIATFLRMCDVLRVEPNDLLLSSQRAQVRNDGIAPKLRRLVALLESADSTTISRLIEVARWLHPGRPLQRGREQARPRRT